MRAFVITDKGFEDMCAKELHQILGTVAQPKEQLCLVNVQSQEDILRIVYKSQTAIKVGELLADGPISQWEDVVEGVFASDYGQWFTGKTFKIVTKVQTLDSLLVIQRLASVVGKKYQTKVGMKNPDTILVAYEFDGILYLGIDYSYENLAKREYRIFLNATALRSTVAANMLLFAEYTPKKVVLDPFCGSGTIPIEAALMATNRSPLYYLKNKRKYASYPIFAKDAATFFASEDKLRDSHKPIYGFDILTKNVDSTKKNAKIAGVIKNISISRVEVDWMDMKLEKVDCIVSSPPLYSSVMDVAVIDKVYKQLFHRAKDMLTKSGCIVLLTNQPNSVSSLVPDYFFVSEKRIVHMGQSEYFCIKITWKK